MKSKKVSFDFDNTLTKKCVQKFAANLISRGYDVWIITSRYFSNYGMIYDNDDLFAVADRLGIKRENIIFTSYNFKKEYITDDFLFHIDDNENELESIKNVPAINVNNKHSINKCWEILENN